MRLARLIPLIAVLALAGLAPVTAAERPAITVFAAASLTDALGAAAKRYEAETHTHIVLSFAASSVLAKQIDASAGADVFLSADEAWMDYLARKGRIETASRVNLLGNSLVLVAPKASTVTLKIEAGPSFAKALTQALAGGRLAVADPETVPAGRYAKEALTALGVWDSVKDHLAPTEDVRVALAFVARGETPLGVVYSTDAAAEAEVRVAGLFPASSHKPIIYPAALIRGAKPGAGAFLAFLGSHEARAIFEKAGFTVHP